MPSNDSALIIAVLIVFAVGATGTWGFGWIARHGGADVISDVAEEVFDSIHAVEFRTAKTAERTINSIRDISLNGRAVERMKYSGEGGWSFADTVPLKEAVSMYLPHVGKDSFFLL